MPFSALFRFLEVLLVLILRLIPTVRHKITPHPFPIKGSRLFSKESQKIGFISRGFRHHPFQENVIKYLFILRWVNELKKKKKEISILSFSYLGVQGEFQLIGLNK